MKMTSDLHVVGGGYFGFGLSGHLDCHVFVLNSGDELALIDPGMGMDRDFDTILDNIRDDGLDPRKIRKLILTHYHCDHIGAAAEAQKRLDVEVYASAFAAPVIRSADEKAVALDVAKAAGFYPDEFRLPPCPVNVELVEGDVVKVGNLELETFETPGPLRWSSQFPHARGRPRLPAGRRPGFLGRQGRLAEHPRLPHRRLRGQHVQAGTLRLRRLNSGASADFADWRQDALGRGLRGFPAVGRPAEFALSGPRTPASKSSP